MQNFPYFLIITVVILSKVEIEVEIDITNEIQNDMFGKTSVRYGS